MRAVDSERVQAVTERISHDMDAAEPVISELLDRHLSFGIGGGIAYSIYAGSWRYTGDLDLFVLPRERENIVDLLQRHGYEDYYDRLPYDRKWIWRGYKNGLIVDVIWQMANYRAQVDEGWFRGIEFSLFGRRVKAISAEELMMAKVYIVQRDRCDWPDLLGLLYEWGTNLDWDHLMQRMGNDRQLLAGLLCVFAWLCPDRCRQFPEWIWERLGLSIPAESLECATDRHRVDLLDSRAWFAPLVKSGRESTRHQPHTGDRPPLR